MLILDRSETLLKWAVLSVLFAALSVLAACTETSGIMSGLRERHVQEQAPRLVPKGPAPSAAAMMGKAASDVENLFGQPSLLREETGAQVWQYANNHCVLLLYLYQDSAEIYRVSHLEARIKGAPQDNIDVCLAATYNT